MTRSSGCARVVLFCCNSVFGVVNFRSGIIRSLVQRGYRVVVVAPRDDHVEKLQSLGAEYVEWHLVARGTRLASEIGAIRRLRSTYRKVRPDLAFHFTIKPVIYGALAARSLRIPFVSVLTGLGYAFINVNWISRAATALYRLTLRWSREVWFLNVDDCEALKSRGLLTGVPIRMLPGEGIDTSVFHPTGRPTSTQPRFLLVARLLRDKGILEFVEAARLLRRRGTTAQFCLLGSVDADNPTAISRQEVDAWHAEGIVTYLGVAHDVRPYIAAADCIVLPSYREGLPRSLLEASAMGKPVIATDVPGCKQAVIDGATGLLCRPRDASHLAETMQRLLDMPQDERERMGCSGRNFVVEHFDEHLVVRHYFDVLGAVAPGRAT